MKKRKVRNIPLPVPPLLSYHSEEEATSSSNRSRRKDDSELVKLSEGSHDEKNEWMIR